MQPHQYTASAFLDLALLKLFPAARLLKRDVVDDGFQNQIDYEMAFDEERLASLEREMRRIAKEKSYEIREQVQASAEALMRHKGQPFLAEQVMSAEAPALFFLEEGGDFTPIADDAVIEDLAGGIFKLYSEGSAISGVWCADRQELKAYERRRAAAAERDWQRRAVLGGWMREPDVWLSRGLFVRDALKRFFIDESLRAGCTYFESPRGVSSFGLDIQTVPLRLLEWDDHGESLDRTTIITDSAHILEELNSSLQFIDRVVKIFGFESCTTLLLSGRPEDDLLKEALLQRGRPYGEDRARDGAGLAMNYVDSIGRKRGQISLRFATGGARRAFRFRDGASGLREPVVLYRSLLGPFERFFAMLMEHTDGRLPLWLQEEEVRLIPVDRAVDGYAASVADALREAAVRVAVDRRDMTVSARIHEGEEARLPYMVVVGEREMAEGTVSFRRSGSETVEKGVALRTFVMITKGQSIES